MSKEDKITQDEKERRINLIFQLIITGMNRKDMLHYVAKNEKWKVEKRQIDNYIHEAMQLLREMGKVDRDAEFGKAIERLNKLYMARLKIKDHKVCLAIQKELNTLLGLNAEEMKTIKIEFVDE